MAYPFVNRWQFSVRRYLADYGDDCAATYSAACSEPNADVVLVDPSCGQLFRVVGGFYIIRRCLCTYDLSDLSPSEAVAKAVLTSIGAWVSSEGGISAYIYDGTSVSTGVAGYGQIGALSTVLGSAYIPNVGLDEYYTFSISFNSAGLAFLESKAGGIAKLAFMVSTEGMPPGECPTISGTETFYLSGDHSLHKLHINSDPGYIWVEGIYLAYLDGNYLKRLKQGATTGTSGAIPGHCWVEPNDTYLRYIDNTGAERIIEGNLFASQGKIAGQIGIRSDLPSYLRYIDGYGNERSFMGELET